MLKDEIDPKFMRMAIEKASQGVDSGQTPFGACIVSDGKVLSLEHNTVWKDTDITSHAEVHAIREACKATGSIDLSGSIIYSTCEPCPMCFSACHWAKISTIVYGAAIEDAKEAGFNELSISNKEMKETGGSGVEIVKDFLREESKELFKYWLKNENRKIY